ncbi:MAG: BON domain-containing protein [Candidatus Lokiarchaeota archaeon]|nr:BON domain-containing protein [Candidatus Lokiarchaeota archaeon]
MSGHPDDIKMIRDKETIKKDIVDQLYWDHRVDASDVKVDVDDDKVTLYGTVPSYFARNAAYIDAYAIYGVTKVVNNLKVQYPPVLKVPSDSDIESNIRNLLLWNESVDSTNINVSVKAGNITLKGTVDAYWKKLTAETVAGRASGVKDIKNELAVVPTDNIVDKAIAKDIVNAIDRHYSLDPEDIDVKVSSGKVTLSGTVENWYDYRSAMDIVDFTTGVIDINDQLVITPE